jgi:hypothetical protein
MSTSPPENNTGTNDTRPTRENLPLCDYEHNSDGEGRWAKKTVLTFGQLCPAESPIFPTI